MCVAVTLALEIVNTIYCIIILFFELNVKNTLCFTLN
jgi:hypothetical protein